MPFQLQLEQWQPAPKEGYRFNSTSGQVNEAAISSVATLILLKLLLIPRTVSQKPIIFDLAS